MVQSIPSRIPICDPKPNDNNIVKKSTAQNGAPGSSTIAWVNTIKAKPVPSAACEMRRDCVKLSSEAKVPA